jgi:protein-export membrane protein SecD
MLKIARWRIKAVALAAFWGFLISAPNFMPESMRAALPSWLPKQTVNLGLDLRGGSHLLLEVDSKNLYKDKLENTVDEMARALADAKPRIGYTGRAVVGDAARIKVLDPADQERALALIRKIPQPLQSASGGGGMDLEIDVGADGAIEARLPTAARSALTRDAVTRSIEVVRRRVDAAGTAEIAITRQGDDRIIVQAPGEQDPESLKRRIGQTAKMTFHMVDSTVSPADAAAGRIPPGSELMLSDDPAEGAVVVRSRAALSGDNLVEAHAGFDQQTQAPIVNFKFDAAGGRIFCQLTTRYTGQRFATVLDGKVITAPRINTPICGGQGYIEGNFTTETANELAVLLRAGALPAPLSVIEQRTVGAELGQDAVNAGLAAGVVAAVLILAFMLLAYGFFGLIACAALVVNLVMILGAMTVFGATLTLPGIAGLILTIAIAVDANVLIYERMRDEDKLGRSVALSIDAGFSRAMVTIIDANITTILAALILFQFGAGPVRGFAWTLSIGTVTSVFTAVLVTQLLIAWWYRAARPKKLPI